MVFSKKFLLKETTTKDDVYKTLSIFLEPCRLCIHNGTAPEHISFSDRNSIVNWKTVKDEKGNKAVYFSLQKKAGEKDLDLKIRFDLEITAAGKGRVHVLELQVREEGYIEEVIELFREIGSFEPACYKITELKNEQWLNNNTEKDCIVFTKSKEETFPFPSEWIKKLAENLSFMSTVFVVQSPKTSIENHLRDWEKKVKNRACYMTSSCYRMPFISITTRNFWRVVNLCKVRTFQFVCK